MKWIDFKKQLQSIGVTEITDGALYMALPSFENVRWLVPLKDKHSFRSALQLYIPNTLKGKLYKFSMEHLPLPLLRRCSAKIVRLDYKNGRFLLRIMKHASRHFMSEMREVTARQRFRC